MPRVVRRWKRLLRGLLIETAEDITSLLIRDSAYKEKSEDAGIFTTAEVTTLTNAVSALGRAANQTTTG